MAYTPRSSSRSSSSRGSSRGGRPSSSRASSGGNPMAMVFAVLLVGGVIAGIVFLMKGKDGPPAPTPSTPAPVQPQAGPAVPKEKPPAPYPPLDPKKVEAIRAEVKLFEPLVKQGQALYDEAMAAKKAGKDDLWQAKLREASAPFDEIQDRWNEIIADMPSSNDYNEEDVANHYLGREGDVVRRALETLAGIKKQRRIQ